MRQTQTRQRPVTHGFVVHPAACFRVSSGVNLGDAMGPADDLALDDIFRLARDAPRPRLSLSMEAGLAGLTVAHGSEAGRAGARVHLDCLATLMALPFGTTVEALVLVVLDPLEDVIDDVLVLPFTPLAAKTDYALVAVDRAAATDRFVELACVSFARGTRITLATGEQRPIETLAPGDRVLTRDNGVQEIRWIGHRTVRAQGSLAPIVIGEGALNNAAELVLSPNHRIFVYQRQDRLGAGRHEIMVRADMLVNGVTVTRGEGGFVDYFQLLFDNHEIVYAEGIATESLPLDPATGPVVPPDLQERLGLPRRGARKRPRAVELPEGMLDAAHAADLLRAASRS